MAAVKRGDAVASKTKGASRRRRREGERRSLNLSVCVEHHAKFRGYAILSNREPSELFMDWVEQHTAGMRFFMPGARPPGESGDGEGGAKDAGVSLATGEDVTSLGEEAEGVTTGAGEGEAEPPPAPRRRRAS